jgi:xanthine/CO dehydrogenase XdhC/CoxF family maturation factor
MNSHQEPNDLLLIASSWLSDGRKAALATVVETWGSSPRPVGSQLIIDDSGRFLGSVSGGCVENAVIQEAQAAIVDGKNRMLEFGADDDAGFGVALTCGGRLRVFVECFE